MSISAIRTITWREVGDTLTDWRILAPMFILAFVLPLLLVSAANFAIRFIADDTTVPLLVPFVMLLVGFIPASFSLITALETFVGERERNSLEALLAMPISDGALYLGKLASSLLPPLISAFTAMGVFCTALWLGYPQLFARGLTAEYILVIVLLITAKAIVMVASAVIISSHTTSVRAANLLASFVLLPTASVVQLEAILIIGRTARAWAVLWLIVLLLAVIAIALIRTGMGAFNREEILSREHEQLNLRQVGRTWMTFFREYRPAGVAPEAYAHQRFSPGRFYRRELPALLRDYRLPIAVALIAALGGLLSGGYIGSTYRVRPLEAYLENIGRAPVPSLGLGLGIAINNMRVAALSGIFSLFVFGVFAFLVPAVAFAQISFVAGSLAGRGGSWLALGHGSPLQFVLAYVLPHGIVELPTAMLGAALGLRVGAALMAPPQGFTVGQNILWSLAQLAKMWLFVLVPLFLLAGLIEGLISPLVIVALYGA
ncbi:stage II sporulation protein M [Kouleothrix sp.]|uniref:stage II sporulation protein M n=1 Tax=Kouleothrix sp. TaxID=2779161 RepID=UPI00391871CE